MQPVRNHSWNLSTDDAICLQLEYASLVERVDRLTSPVQYVAGVDVAYGMENDHRVFAVVVVIDLTNLQTVETATAITPFQSEYVPGLFAFRELPALCQAMDAIESPLELVICDGQGLAHPRRCGVASHFGVLFDIPTIGCGKTRLLGSYAEPDPLRGEWSDLIDGSEVIGRVLRTQNSVKPLFVSIGNRVSLATASDWILRLAPQFRQPEPIRRANQLANELREKNSA